MEKKEIPSKIANYKRQLHLIESHHNHVKKPKRDMVHCQKEETAFELLHHFVSICDQLPHDSKLWLDLFLTGLGGNTVSQSFFLFFFLKAKVLLSFPSLKKLCSQRLM